jgi:small conductance mechanosensitive channel
VSDWIFSHLPRILVILVLALVLVRIARRVVARLERRLEAHDANSQREREGHRSKTLVSVIMSALMVGIWSLALMQILGELGVKLGPMLAGAGIAGIALGFGAQSLVRDFLAGFFILLEDQFRVGDQVELAGVVGRVERFTLRMTSVRAVDGTLHHVPNGQMNRVANASADWSRALVDIQTPASERSAAVSDALNDAGGSLANDPQISEFVVEAPQILGTEDLRGPNVTTRVAIGVVPGNRVTVARSYRKHVKEAFERAGISLESTQAMIVQGQAADDQGDPPQAQPPIQAKPPAKEGGERDASQD